MVTEEERLAMYRSFAPAAESRINLGIRHRLVPLLGNGRRRIELMNALLCSLPGTPVLYYGDEIGMGDNIYLGDRDGVRTPTQWSADRNAGFSDAPAQRLYLPLIVDYEYHHAMVHVEAQEQNAHSLLAYMKRLLALRKRYRAFGRGSLAFLEPANHRVLAFVREWEDERILVVANLSRFGQAVELDLGAYRGLIPMELFGRTSFWPISDDPYRLTLGPHAFYWFAIVPAPVTARADADSAGSGAPPLALIAAADPWPDLLTGRERGTLEEALAGFLDRQPWFRGRIESILGVAILDAVPLGAGERDIFLVPVNVDYSDRDAETYLLALQVVPADTEPGTGAIARIRSGDGDEGVLVDAIEEGTIYAALGRKPDAEGAPSAGRDGEIVELRNGAGWPAGEVTDHPMVTSHFAEAAVADGEKLGRLVVKFLRRIKEGVNPEWEVGAALTDVGFPHVPTVLGALEYRRPKRPPLTLAVIQVFVPNSGNAWDFTLETLRQYLTEALTQGLAVPNIPEPTAWDLLDAAGETPPQPLAGLIGDALAFARLLGSRTAGLHQALANADALPHFAPEPFSSFTQSSLYQSMRGLNTRVLRRLRQALPDLDDDERRLAGMVVEQVARIEGRFARVLDRPVSGFRIRGHGDYHLRQVLRTGDDVVIVDFEGEPDRYLEERGLRISPLRDVACMLHSFRAATRAALLHVRETGIPPEDDATLDAVALVWYQWVGAAFLDAYQRGAGMDAILPVSAEERARLIDALVLEKAIYELGYTLDHVPGQSARALQCVIDLLGDPE